MGNASLRGSASQDHPSDGSGDRGRSEHLRIKSNAPGFSHPAGVSEAPLPRMPAKWSTLSARQVAHLVYFLCFVKTLRKEPETTES